MPLLQELLRHTDCLSIHCDLNDTSRNLIGAKELAQLRRGSFVVNTARGGIIVETALAEALKSGHITAAGERSPFKGCVVAGPLHAIHIMVVVIWPSCF